MKYRSVFYLFLLLFITVFTGCSGRQAQKTTFVVFSTTLGDVKIELSDSTPHHKSNFIKLVQAGYYDGILFHRVINNFMIQAGDVSTRVPADGLTNDTLSTFTLPAEISASLFHHKGAVAAARTGNEVNPEMRSSGTQFYIVQGTVLTDPALDEAEGRINAGLNQLLFIRTFRHLSDSLRSAGASLSEAEIQEKASLRLYEHLSLNQPYTIPSRQREIYKTLGGVPRLDQTYTVFGKVVEGLDVVDKIASVPTDNRDKPQSDVRITRARITYN